MLKLSLFDRVFDRRYRRGELPDIQITRKDLLDPLQASEPILISMRPSPCNKFFCRPSVKGAACLPGSCSVNCSRYHYPCLVHLHALALLAL